MKHGHRADNGCNAIHSVINQHAKGGWTACSPGLLSICIVAEHVQEKGNSYEVAEPRGDLTSQTIRKQDGNQQVWDNIEQEANQRDQVGTITKIGDK